MKPYMAVIVVVSLLAAIIMGGWMLKAVLLPVKTVTAQIDSAGNIIDNTYDAENAIYNYEWFKSQYEDIQATERIIGNTNTELAAYRDLYGNASTWDWQTKSDYNSLHSKYLGQQNYYEGLVADYNARSQMANRNIFKDKLPLHVDAILW